MCVGSEEQDEDTGKSATPIIDVQFSLTGCNGKYGNGVVSVVCGKMKTPTVQWHSTKALKSLNLDTVHVYTIGNK